MPAKGCLDGAYRVKAWTVRAVYAASGSKSILQKNGKILGTSTGKTHLSNRSFSSAQPDGDFRMKILMISAVAAIALLAGTAGILRSPLHPVGTAGMPTMQELHGSANVDKLLAEDFEDRSLVFSRETKH
jgi:hypothetical protein